MKKRLFIILTATMAVAAMQAQWRPVTTTAVTAETTAVTHLLYDAQGNLILSLTQGSVQTLYTYNEQQQLIRKDSVGLGTNTFERSYTYTYNAQGQVESEEECLGERSLGVTTYSYDSHGNVDAFTNSRGGVTITQQNTYDAEGHLVKADMYNPIYGVCMQSTSYTYEAGHLVSKTIGNGAGEVASVTTYTYDEQGLLTEYVVKDAEGGVLSTTTLSYADIDAAFAPYHVTAMAGEGNTIVVTWEGTATEAIVDGVCYSVTGNTFTTPVLTDGAYAVYLSNKGNTTVSEIVDVADNTKCGVSEVRLDGDITRSVALEQNSDGEDVEVVTYLIPIAWTLPTGATPIGYRIYYNSIYYVDVEDGSLRSFTIPAKNIKAWSMASGEYILDFVIRVIAIYQTGEMEPANRLELDTERILALHMEESTADGADETKVYTLDGIRMPYSDNLRPGTYVLRRGKVTRKVQTR